MEQTKYEVVFMGNHPDGLRHPVKVVTTATNASAAIGIAKDALEDDRIESVNHELVSVMPSSPSQPDESDSNQVLQQGHQQALRWLADAYVFHQRIKRRQIVRIIHGDLRKALSAKDRVPQARLQQAMI